MKYLLALSVILILGACNKPNEPNNSNSSTYFFNCDVDGKKIKLTYTPNNSGVSSNGVLLNAYVGNVIHIDASSTQCSTAGSYCVSQAMDISAQKIGTYKISYPHVFIFATTEGSDVYTYMSTSGILNVIFDKIEHNGRLEGTFSGTVSKQKFTGATAITTTYPIVNISGNFSFPIQ